MSKDKKVDEILNELSTNEKKDSAVGVKTNNSDKKISNTVVYSPSQIKAIEEAIAKRPAPSHMPSKFAVSDVGRPNVSYINSVTEVRKTSADLPPKPTDIIDGYDGAVMRPQPVDESYIPKVRKMSNSTRAKEMRAKRRKKNKKIDFTYAKETPDGVYIKPEKKKRKFIINREADEKASAPQYDDNGQIIPLSQQADPNALDIDISESVNENTDDTRRENKKHIKSSKTYDKKQAVRDYDSFEDAKEIRRDIVEVRDNFGFRVAVLAFMLVFSCYISIGEFLHIPVPSMLSPEKSPANYCWVQLLTLALSSIVSFTTFKNGIASLLKFKADSDSLTALAILSTGAASVTSALMGADMVKSGCISIYVPIAILSLLLNATGKKLILNRMLMNFEYISKNNDTHAIVNVEDSDRAESLTRGTTGDFPILTTMRRTNFIKDFASYTYSADTGDKFSRILTPITLIISFLLAAGVTFLKMKTFDSEAIAFGLYVFSASISGCSCLAIPLIANIPLEKVAQKCRRNRGIMLGYQSVEDFYDTNSVMVGAETFFPIGTVSLSSVKLFSGTKIDTALLEAASLTSHGNSILKDLFSNIVADKIERLSSVENFACEESMGLCGWINNRRILFGNRELMTNHKIEGIPTLTKEKEFTEGGKDALYLSVSGSLAAMFIIEVSASYDVVKCMQRLKKKDIAVIVRTVDPFITINRLSTLFGYPEDLIKIIPPRMVHDYEEETKSERKVSASMACAGSFTSFMNLILGTKSIKKTVGMGIVFQSVTSLLGFVLVAMNTVLSAYSNISTPVIFGYQLACTLLTALLVKLRKI